MLFTPCALCSVQFSEQRKINQVNCAICCLNWFTTLTVFICLNNHCCCGCCGIASPQPLFVYLDSFAAIFDEKNITDIIIIHNLGNILEERNCLHARAKKKRHKLIRTAKYSHFSESFANCWSCNLLDLCNNGFDLHFYLPLHWSLLYYRASMESHGSASKMHSVSVVSYAISLT